MAWKWKVLRAGAFGLDGGAMFGIIPRPLWTRQVEPDDRNRIPLNTNCVLLERDGQRVLIETGIGDKLDEKKRDIFAAEERSIVDALTEENVDPADITTIVVSHLHFDHAGGLTRRGAGGAAVPTFPNAKIVVQQREWDDALANHSTMHSTYLRDHLDPVAEQVRTPQGKEDILPGLWVEPSAGHTWGQQLVFFEDDQGRTVVFMADLIPTIHHASTTWGMAYDVLPYKSMQAKKQWLAKANDEGWLLILSHNPEETVFRVVPHEKRAGEYALQPVEG